MRDIVLNVNGKTRHARIEERTLLVSLLRDTLGLTGTHVGCDTSQCGACVVSVEGETVKSCSVLAATLPDGTAISTIESLATSDALHPMQQAFSECHALQCGYCTPGLVITAIDIVRKNPEGLTPDLIRKELKGNICRCTGYLNIIQAIMRGAAAMGVPTLAAEGEAQ